MTFTDIWRDYLNYRKAYFYHPVAPTPKEQNLAYLEKHPVPNLDTYSTWKTLKYLVNADSDHFRRASPEQLFNKMFWVTVLFITYLVVSLPRMYYYNWWDPYAKS